MTTCSGCLSSRDDNPKLPYVLHIPFVLGCTKYITPTALTEHRVPTSSATVIHAGSSFSLLQQITTAILCAHMFLLFPLRCMKISPWHPHDILLKPLAPLLHHWAIDDTVASATPLASAPFHNATPWRAMPHGGLPLRRACACEAGGG